MLPQRRDATLHLLVAAVAIGVCQRGDLGDVPFILNVLPYAPPAMFMLIGYLGGQMNQSRLLFSAAAFLCAYGLLAHPGLLVPEALVILAVALPVSLALVFTIPEGRIVSERTTLRVFFVMVPVVALAAFLNAFPADFAQWLSARRIAEPRAFTGLPVAAFAGLLPLILSVVLLRRDRIAPILPALLTAVLPVFEVIALASPGQTAAAGLPEARAAVACTCSAGILLHAVVRLLWHHAYRDELTGLPNRRALEQELATLAPPFAIAMIDLDRFKRFNDRYGHDQGDQALRYTGVHLQQAFGPRVFRYGGEEFCAVLPGASMQRAFDLVERARQDLVRAGFRRRSGWGWMRYVVRWWAGGIPHPRSIRFTMSAGVAASVRRSAAPLRIRAAADAALYRAKTAGRNRVVAAGVRSPGARS